MRIKTMSALAIIILASCTSVPAGPKRAAVYVGTYTGRGSKGIYYFELDLETGKATKPSLAAECASPNFLAFHPNGKLLYSVGRKGREGMVNAFAIRGPGKLELLNQQPAGGSGPCHLAIDPTGRCVIVANYGSGSTAALSIEKDGKLKAPACVIQHKGSGPNERRQKGPHAHSVNLDAAGKFAFVADLGIDKVLIFKVDAPGAKLAPNDPDAAKVAPGSGPRHFCFHPTGRYAYVINELLCTVTAFKYDASRGALTEIHTITTLPKDFKESNSTAEVLVTPDGRFLYGSNRGHDSIAEFSIDGATGRLTPIGHTPTGGKRPRNFGIDPTGQFLLAANQDSASIFIFRIDPKTGKLRPTGGKLEIASPVCVRMLPLE
jgi:6-phosphogluconolactonase